MSKRVVIHQPTRALPITAERLRDVRYNETERVIAMTTDDGEETIVLLGAGDLAIIHLGKN